MNYYLTDDRNIKQFTVVMVPTPDGPDKPAMVLTMLICNEKNAPYPVGKTKKIRGIAGLNEQLLFTEIRSRLLAAERDRKQRARELERRRKIELEREREIKRVREIEEERKRESARKKDDLGWLDQLIFLDAIYDDDE